MITEDDASLEAYFRELKRAINCKTHGRKFDYSKITFAELLMFFNIKEASSYVKESANPTDMMFIKNYLKDKKAELENEFPIHSMELSKWINLINSRRSMKKILMDNALSFLTFMRNKLTKGTYKYLLKIYTVEKGISIVRNYELVHVQYESLDTVLNDICTPDMHNFIFMYA